MKLYIKFVTFIRHLFIPKNHNRNNHNRNKIYFKFFLHIQQQCVSCSVVKWSQQIPLHLQLCYYIDAKTVECFKSWIVLCNPNWIIKTNSINYVSTWRVCLILALSNFWEEEGQSVRQYDNSMIVIPISDKSNSSDTHSFNEFVMVLNYHCPVKHPVIDSIAT